LELLSKTNQARTEPLNHMGTAGAKPPGMHIPKGCRRGRLVKSFCDSDPTTILHLTMARRSFFLLGLANSVLLILVFIIRGKDLSFIESYGWIYLLLAIPALWIFVIVRSEKNARQYRMILGIFLLYLLIEGLLDFVLKNDFRDNWWILGPYIALYDVMNFGFIVMQWKVSRRQGILMLALFVVQLLANYSTH
jgi:hypothetical protein